MSNKLRVVLIQVRERDDVELHEQQCVMEQCGLAPSQLVSVSVVKHPDLPDAALDGDVVMIGGAGVFSVTQDYPFNERLGEVVRALVNESRPLLGLCWGHQFIAKALGGRVITDKSRSEVGTFGVELTDEGARDALFEGIPRRFAAHMGHHDRVSELPPGGVELCRSELCDNQVFRIADKPIYGAQFHIEMTPQRLSERLKVYAAEYLGNESGIAEDDARLAPTPEANSLMRRFLEVALVGA